MFWAVAHFARLELPPVCWQNSAKRLTPIPDTWDSHWTGYIWWHFKSRLTGCAGAHILSLVQPRGFSQKAQADRWLKAAVGRPKENYLKTAEKNALRKATPTQLLPETRLQRYSEFKNLLSLCCENTQRITCVELALLKPPQAAALYVWPVPGAVGQGCCWRVSKVESSVGLG